MRHYYYLTHDNAVIRIHDKRKPSAKDRIGVWACFEQHQDGNEVRWCATWEISWGMLSKQTYIGSLPPSTPGESLRGGG